MDTSDPRSVTQLNTYIATPQTPLSVKVASIEKLSAYKHPEAAQVLAQVAAKEESPMLRQNALKSLVKLDHPQAHTKLKTLYLEGDRKTKLVIITNISYFRRHRHLAILKLANEESDTVLTEMAQKALKKLGKSK